MLLLAADTSGRNGSIALARGQAKGVCEVIEVVPLAGGTFSAQLIPQIAALLAKHGYSKNDIGGFVVASGPGSFTGLRVGLAAIKGLAEILEKPLAAVSLLEAVAVASLLQGRVVTALDAGRGDVYVGEYEIASDSATLISERLMGKNEALAAAKGAKLVTSEKAFAECARTSGLPVVVIDAVDAGIIAPVGWRKIEAGDTVLPDQLDANYIRRSDAEIFSKSSS
jgi:tRNA threonylcarbamoyladenosine biosynthesis protein TsaB